MAEFSGFPVSYDNLPNETKAKIAVGINQVQFAARLKAGGTVTLNGNELVLGGVSFTENSLSFLALDRLELLNGARIVTNGNSLVIFTNTLASQNGSIVSFRPNELQAIKGADGSSPGSPGSAGNPGDHGGLVSIHVIEAIEGNLTIDLPGQRGGSGGAGAQGHQGARGPKGANAVDGTLYCAAGGQDGGMGGQGLPGGPGGSAGSGGQGGYSEIYNVGAQPVPDAAITFSAPGGAAGQPGQGGPGGAGGEGGEGGNGSHFCGGGHGGPSGPAGPSGTVGTSGLAGANGQLLRKNLDLQLIINQAVKVPISNL